MGLVSKAVTVQTEQKSIRQHNTIVRSKPLNKNGSTTSNKENTSYSAPLTESSHVLGVTNVPVNRGKVLALGKLLVQPPKDLHNRQGG